MGAVLIHDRLTAMLDRVQLRHGFTYNGHPVGAAVALANLDIIDREGLCKRAVAIGRRMLERLEPAEGLEAVSEVRGVGAMLGVELSGDLDGGAVAAAVRRRGVIVRGSGQKIVMSPPLVIEDGQADRVADALLAELKAL
jgi:putrescine aminotransferase